MRGTTFGQGSAAVSLFAEVVAWIMGELDAKELLKENPSLKPFFEEKKVK